MISAAAGGGGCGVPEAASSAKIKEDRKGKNVIRGWKRDRDRDRDRDQRDRERERERARRERAGEDDGSPPSPHPPVFLPSGLPEHLPWSPDPRVPGPGGGDPGAAGIPPRPPPGGRTHVHQDEPPAPKKLRGADKVEPMFTVPAPPAPAHPGALGSSLPSVPTFSPPALPTRTRSVGTSTQDGGTPGWGAPPGWGGPPAPEGGDSGCLGPCQPGTSVNLEGIVWHETQEGVLVVNVTWRKRTYVGTLLDCTKHDWAPPRFCESPCSDPDLPGSRGRGKRMRLAMAERPFAEPSTANANAKVRGLSHHRSRGGGATAGTASIHSKGRRASLNLINNFFTVDEVKPVVSGVSGGGVSASLSSGKRKNKPPADLDLSFASSDNVKNGKRIRAKSRSAPSTPQGKSDPSFLDPGGGGASSPPPPLPILIDCPHPNCTKRYKHINGLRYHQTHAHLEADEQQRKPDGDGDDRLTDGDDDANVTSYDLTETSLSSKKPAPLYKVTTVGSPKNRRLLLSTDHNNVNNANAKARRTSSLLKDGLLDDLSNANNAKPRRTSSLLDDLSNLPIISNMTVVLENCMVSDRASSSSVVEMPKLEAEGPIEKKGSPGDKARKANGKVEKPSKSNRTNRPIAPAPAPPKLIAIPNATTYNTSAAAPADVVGSQQPSPLAAVSLTSKNLPLKPIKPKLSVVVEPGLVKAVAAVAACSGKDARKKEKRRLKDKHGKDAPARTPNGSDGDGIRTEEAGGGGAKPGVKEVPGSLLKEHLSKQEVMNGLLETQESRMASIRAEADKVYTFTDNAPSPSIGGSSSRLDSGGGGCCLATVDGGSGGSKNNSPAYSDISDAGDEGGGGSDGLRSSKSGSSSEASSGSGGGNHGNPGKTPPSTATKECQSPYYHGYEPYYLQGCVAFHKGAAAHDCKGKDRKEDVRDDDKSSSHDGPTPSQLQLAMSQTQTALAQSLYYGQYSRGLYMDQKMLLASKCCDQTPPGKQRGQGAKDLDDVQHLIGGSAGGPVLGKGPDGSKVCCAKPGGSGAKGIHGGGGMAVDQHQVVAKDCDDIKSPSSSSSSSSSSSLHNPNSHTDLDSNVSFSSPSDGPGWPHHHLGQGQHGDEAEEGEADGGKECWATMELAGAKMPSGGGRGGDAKKSSRGQGCHELLDEEDPDGLEGLENQDQDPMGGLLSEESQTARAAVSPPMTPQQPYIQYQHSSYPPYLAMCEGGGSYRGGASPTLVHSYPGFHYPLYGKTAGREESEVTPPTRGGAISGKPMGDSTSELLPQPSHQFLGKSPAPGEKGSPEEEREAERERNHLSFARHLHTHHHTHLGMSYNLLTGQYDIYQGLSSRSLVSSQQAGHSSTDGEGKK